MFDPHRTRRSDKRYYTRKGQVIQAGKVNTKPIIDQRLVPVYKNYLITNNLISPPPPPPTPSTKITIDAVSASSIAQTFPTNQLGYSGAEGGEVDLSQFRVPRVLLTIYPQTNDYLIVIFMVGSISSMHVDPETYYVVFGLNTQGMDYDIKFLSGNQAVLSVQDQVGDPDNTTFLLSKSKYSISLPA